MSKKQNRRIFGMSSFQLVVLMILSLMAVTLIFGGFIYISNSSRPNSNTFFPTAQLPDLSQPENLYNPAETSDLPPEAIFVPNNEPPPSDWVRYSNVRIELWLPPQFESVFVEPERQARVAFYRQQGYNFLADELENTSFDIRFWFNFPQPDTVPYKTSVLVKEDILPTDTLNDYIDQAYGANLQIYEFAGGEEFIFADFEARRILMTATVNDLSFGVVDYVITDGVNLWIIRCGSSLDEFYTWLPQFDKIAQSFRLIN